MAMKQKINPLTGNFDMVSDGDSGTIKQKFNPLTGNFDMVGEGEVKMKLNPLTSNFDMVSEGGGGGGLPDAYQEVEYIESDVENGYGQVIDTGIYSGETISAEIKFKYNSDHFGDDRGIFGTYWTGEAFLLTHYFQNIRWHNYGNWADYGDDGNIRIIKVTPEEIIIDGNTYQQGSYGQSAEEDNHTICLFTTHRWSYEGGGYVLERCGAYKLYYFKIWDGETLVRDMIPCYRKADNIAGMYDLVEGVFYTNQGTGNFIIPSPTETVNITIKTSDYGKGLIENDLGQTAIEYYAEVPVGSQINYDDPVLYLSSGHYSAVQNRGYYFSNRYPAPSIATEDITIDAYWQNAMEVNTNIFTESACPFEFQGEGSITVNGNFEWVQIVSPNGSGDPNTPDSCLIISVNGTTRPQQYDSDANAFVCWIYNTVMDTNIEISLNGHGDTTFDIAYKWVGSNEIDDQWTLHL